MKHFQGDPVQYDSVAKLLKKQRFDTAICLGNVVNKDLPQSARDARVLSMLLILRRLTKGQLGKPMGIIAESFQDQTSGLALAPVNARDRG